MLHSYAIQCEGPFECNTFVYALMLYYHSEIMVLVARSTHTSLCFTKLATSELQ